MGISLKEAEEKKAQYVDEDNKSKQKRKDYIIKNVIPEIDRLISINIDTIKEKSINLAFNSADYSDDEKDEIAYQYIDFTVNVYNGLSIKMANAEWKW